MDGKFKIKLRNFMDININELHEKFSEYGKNSKEWQRKCALLLPEIARLEVWKAKGFSCIHEYAAKLAGMSKGQVNDALYILRKIEDKPTLMKVVEEKGLNAVRPVVAIATVENEKFLAGRARKMGHHALRVFVNGVGREVLAVHGLQQVRGAPKYENKIKIITMQLSEKLADRLDKFRNGKKWEKTVEELLNLAEKARREEKYKLQKKLEAEKPESVKTDSRHIPNKIRSYVLKRAGEKCEFPNCGEVAKNLHHIDRFSSRKIHDPDKIVALCEAHHDLAHRGLIDNEEERVENWKIRKERDYANLNYYVDRQYELYRR